MLVDEMRHFLSVITKDVPKESFVVEEDEWPFCGLLGSEFKVSSAKPNRCGVTFCVVDGFPTVYAGIGMVNFDLEIDEAQPPQSSSIEEDLGPIVRGVLQGDVVEVRWTKKDRVISQELKISRKSEGKRQIAIANGLVPKWVWRMLGYQKVVFNYEPY